jgi:hypothetical protein
MPDVPSPVSESDPHTLDSIGTSEWSGITDNDTGVTIDLPGGVRETWIMEAVDGQLVPGKVYACSDSTGLVSVGVHISQNSTEIRPDPQGVAETTARQYMPDTELLVSRPVIVNGNNAVDAEMTWSGEGTGVLFLRVVDTPRYGMTLYVAADVAYRDRAQQIFDRINTSMRVP